MNVSQEELNQWAERAFRVNGDLLQVRAALERGDIAVALTWLENARQRNWQTEKALVAAGADDPIDARVEELEREDEARIQAGMDAAQRMICEG